MAAKVRKNTGSQYTDGARMAKRFDVKSSGEKGASSRVDILAVRDEVCMEARVEAPRRRLRITRCRQVLWPEWERRWSL